MISNGGSVGKYWTIINNKFQAIHDNGYGILGYLTDHTLVQNNRFSDFTASESKAIGPKMGNSMWFIRDNRINMSTGEGIWVDTYATGSSITKDIEISYNLVQMSSGYALWVGQEPATYGSVTSFRNTYVGGKVSVDNLSSSNGPVSLDKDVIVNNSGTTKNITTNSGQLSSLMSLLKIGNLLTGSSSAGIVDSQGNLSGSYTQYVGTYGYQRSGTSEKIPMSPASVSVQ
jgi:hypothetical protein